jgi:hypothetical protein
MGYRARRVVVKAQVGADTGADDKATHAQFGSCNATAQRSASAQSSNARPVGAVSVFVQ